MSVLESPLQTAATALDGGRRQTARPRRGLVLGLACAAQAMVGLDIAIVNVAVPSIQRALGISQISVQWIVVAYGLLLGGFLLVGGRMTDLLGRRRILIAGLGLFTTASLPAGMAEHGGVLITARGLQGLGGALIAPAALSLPAVTFGEGHERNRALGLFGAVGAAAGTVGVVAGGLIAAGPGWRMREIGPAAGVAAVSTVLVAGSGLAGFHAAFAAIGVLAGLGAIIAAIGFRRAG